MPRVRDSSLRDQAASPGTGRLEQQLAELQTKYLKLMTLCEKQQAEIDASRNREAQIAPEHINSRITDNEGSEHSSRSIDEQRVLLRNTKESRQAIEMISEFNGYNRPVEKFIKEIKEVKQVMNAFILTSYGHIS